MNRLFLIALIVLMGLGARPAAAQQAAPEPSGYALYQRGYEAQKEDRLVGAAMSSRATLEQKRAAVAAPAFQQSLLLLRQGLNQGIDLREEKPEASAWTVRSRNYMRQLLLEQYVLLADGRTRAAVDSFGDALRLGEVGADPMRGGTIGAALTSSAVDAMLVSAWGRHLDQLSLRDCERIEAIIRRRAIAPVVNLALVENERQSTREEVTEQVAAALAWAANPEAGKNLSDDFEVEPKDWEALRRWRGDANAEAALRAAVSRWVDRTYDQAIVMARDPAKARFAAGQRIATPGGTPVALMSAGPAQTERVALAIVSASVLPDIVFWEVEQAIRNQARLRLFAVRVGLRRWWWEHGEYPEGLEEAVPDAGSALADPFTGRALIYKKLDRDTFSLESAGGPKRDADGEVVSGAERTPLTLTSAALSSPPPL